MPKFIDRDFTSKDLINALDWHHGTRGINLSNDDYHTLVMVRILQELETLNSKIGENHDL